MTIAASQKTLSPSTTRLPWPPPKQGVLIRVAESPLAIYCILFGFSEWHLVNPRPWLYLHPMKCLRGHTTGEPCGEMEKLTLFCGPDAEARRQVEKIFSGMAAHLRKLAATEKEGAA